MIRKKERLVFLPDVRERVLIKDGKKFRLIEEVIGKDEHVKKVIFEEFDEEKHNRRIEKLTNYLIAESKISIKDVIKNILMSVELKTLDKFEKKMKKKVKVRIKKGCVGLQFGNEEIPIID